VRPAAWILCLAASSLLPAQTHGETTLPAWTPGTLDIHHISTGRGNSTFLILPDGTTLLVDAGAAADGIPQTDPHPDALREPGAVIADYIQRHLPPGATGLDYALITHFHADHYGQVTQSSRMDSTGAYALTGITQVDESLPIRTLLDRGSPDYSYPVPLTDKTMANYRKFIEVKSAHGMTVARFKPGSATQIRLLKDASRYPTFEIRNLIANGEVWTGTGEQTRQLFPPLASLTPADFPTENMCSLGLRLRYGPFRYFTGGDLPGTQDPGFPAWHAIEPALAPVVGPVDVQVINQHGSMGEASDTWLEALRSKVLIIPSWAPSHPAPDVLKRIINSRFAPSSRQVYATDIREAARIVIGARANQLAGPPGHIVVRVEAGGARYAVWVLDYHDRRDKVLAGPITLVPPG